MKMNQGLWLGHSKVVNDGETPPSAGVSPSPWLSFSLEGTAEFSVGTDLAKEPSNA